MISDLLRQVNYELYFFPDSCLSKIVMDWYNATYVALGDSTSFQCCQEEAPTDEQAIVDALVDLALSQGRRGGLRLIRRVFRLALRELIQNLASG